MIKLTSGDGKNVVYVNPDDVSALEVRDTETLVRFKNQPLMSGVLLCFVRETPAEVSALIEGAMRGDA